MRRLSQLLVILFIVILIFPLFLTSTIEATVEKEIALPADLLFDDFNNLNKLSKWEPWASEDSVAIKEYFSPYEGKGAGYEWKSKEMQGIFTIIFSKKNDSIHYKLEGFGFGDDAEMSVSFQTIDSLKTNVKWQIKSQPVTYFSRYFTYFKSGHLKEKLENGFNKLEKFGQTQKVVNAQPNSLKTDLIKTEQFEGLELITMLNDTTLENEEMKTATDESLALLYSYLTDFLKLPDSELGNPVSYYDFVDISANKAKFHSGYPIKSPVKLGEDMELLSIPAKTTLTYIYKGDISKLNEVLDKMKNYAKKNNLKLENLYWLEFVSDSKDLKNKENLLTKVFIPIKE